MRIRFGLSLLCWTSLLAAPVASQGRPDLSDLVGQWAGGSFRAPVSCEIDGELRQGVRRVLIEPRKFPGRNTALELRFIDLRPGEASRCVDSKGHPLPNLVGTLELRWPGRSRPETALRDFRETLKRKKGFDFVIVQGHLKHQPVARPAQPARVLDFSGGECRISLLYPATDEARELAAFQSQRKFVITMKTKSGESLTLPLFDPEMR